eukprot:6844860-Pyramimonas_sp.AAC.1
MREWIRQRLPRVSDAAAQGRQDNNCHARVSGGTKEGCPSRPAHHRRGWASTRANGCHVPGQRHPLRWAPSVGW